MTSGPMLPDSTETSRRASVGEAESGSAVSHCGGLRPECQMRSSSSIRSNTDITPRAAVEQRHHRGTSGPVSGDEVPQVVVAQFRSRSSIATSASVIRALPSRNRVSTRSFEHLRAAPADAVQAFLVQHLQGRLDCPLHHKVLDPADGPGRIEVLGTTSTMIVWHRKGDGSSRLSRRWLVARSRLSAMKRGAARSPAGPTNLSVHQNEGHAVVTRRGCTRKDRPVPRVRATAGALSGGVSLARYGLIEWYCLKN